MSTRKLTCLVCGQLNRVYADRPAAAAKCGTCGARLFPNKPAEIDTKILAKAARADEVPLVVDFWAPWCGPCRMMAPEFSKAAETLKGTARFAKLNTEDHPDAGARYNIRGIPMLAAFAGGRERGRQTGAQRADAIASWVRSLS